MHEKIESRMEMVMACLLLVSFYLLSRENGCCCFSTDEFSETDSYRSRTWGG